MLPLMRALTAPRPHRGSLLLRLSYNADTFHQGNPSASYSTDGTQFTPMPPPTIDHSGAYPAHLQQPQSYHYQTPAYNQQHEQYAPPNPYLPPQPAQLPYTPTQPNQQYTPAQQTYNPSPPTSLPVTPWAPHTANFFSIAGLLATPPDMRVLSSGMPRAHMNLASVQSDGSTRMFKVDAYGPTAEQVATIAPGQMVVLSGEMRQQQARSLDFTYNVFIARAVALVDPTTVPAGQWPQVTADMSKPSPKARDRMPTQSARSSYDMYYQQGMALQQVAEARGMAVSTVLGHMLDWGVMMKAGVDWDRVRKEVGLDTGAPDGVTTAEILPVVEGAMQEGVPKLMTMIRQRLLAPESAMAGKVAAQEAGAGGPGVTFNQIRVVMAWRQQQQQQQ